ncbi:tautomerase family protein [Actinomycetospora sp. CA-084318]|uniref:tautomerase family protein n=1 Tax=Actinomycetospora sp. CA-084318 TaxID=3239892 RepID=UPI003D97F875
MPFVRLTLNRPELPQETVDTLASTITDLLAQDLRKIARITVMSVDLQPERSWFVGAAPVEGVGGHLDVLLSDGINTDEEKAAFIAHAHAELGRILGPLASVFYVALHEVPPLNWGYNGIPQGVRVEETD